MSILTTFLVLAMPAYVVLMFVGGMWLVLTADERGIDGRLVGGVWILFWPFGLALWIWKVLGKSRGSTDDTAPRPPR